MACLYKLKKMPTIGSPFKKYAQTTQSEGVKR
jgi:hypothetical protein